MRKGSLLVLLVNLLVMLIVVLSLLSQPRERLIFSATQRVPQLGLNFSLEYNVTGGHRPR